MAEGDDERCKHGEVAAWCGESECMAARTKMPVRVWRTKQGQAFHRKPDCEALLDGQAMAVRHGREATEPQQVPLSDAMSAGLGECYHCFPPDVPADAKPCKVLVDGRWVDGLVLKWFRGPDQRWKALVNYRHEAVRTQAVIDQADLRPAKNQARTTSQQ